MKRWFVYDPDGDGFSLYESESDASKAAANSLDLCRADACEGWPDGTEGICWGEVRERVVETRRLEKPLGVTLDADGIGSDGVDYSEIPSGCDALVDYELRGFEEGTT